MLSGSRVLRSTARRTSDFTARAAHTSSHLPRFTHERRLAFVLATTATVGFAVWNMLEPGRALHLEGPDESGTSKSKAKRKTDASSKAKSASLSSDKLDGEPDAKEFIEDKAAEADVQSGSYSGSDVGASDGSGESGGANGGAYDPVTGEISWDCPCLGGMAHGPCGPQFREAFSCFVYSEEEPKGIECVEKFKAMQDCFREHPDVYAEEIMDEDDDEELGTQKKPEKEESTEDDVPNTVPSSPSPEQEKEKETSSRTKKTLSSKAPTSS